MLKRRENLLILPWQQRRFKSHREKIKSARPVIDSGPPKDRGHVTVKLKKLQCEEERTEKIKQDNIRLLQRMTAIMRTSRLDNQWITEPSRSLEKKNSMPCRIGIYGQLAVSKKIKDEMKLPDLVDKKSECSACRIKQMQREFEDVQPKQEYLRRAKMAILPRESDFDLSVDESRKLKKERPKSAKGKTRWSAHPTRYSTKPVVKLRPLSGNKVVFTRGPLEVSVSYPNHTQVVLKRIGSEPRIIDSEFCQCRAPKLKEENKIVSK
ncbi:uncharacterized protein LOC132203380 [Neocloeon triangulifer]|uniref:uncharacterized protein LOC132203380 n=1 Tax=Neocloeon triangulifer TaxID=2078957 RepID=UPI00286F3470|nr:uncharacterized protein LOC132203380 [Neocloeon triangulifer]